LNIPLLLETGHYSCDYVVVIISKRSLRKERFLQREKQKNPKNFLARKAELEKRFNAITRAQLSDAKRKKNADFAIYNNGSKLELVGCVDRLLKKLPA
jgi:dephospho-CoA kinase